MIQLYDRTEFVELRLDGNIKLIENFVDQPMLLETLTNDDA